MYIRIREISYRQPYRASAGNRTSNRYTRIVLLMSHFIHLSSDLRTKNVRWVAYYSVAADMLDSGHSSARWGVFQRVHCSLSGLRAGHPRHPLWRLCFGTDLSKQHAEQTTREV